MEYEGGYIGRNICRGLVKDEHEVESIDNSSKGSMEK